MNVLHTHSRHVTQNHVQPCSRLRSDMVRPATARLPVIMSVRPTQRWHTTAARPRLKPLRHRLRRHQNRNTAGVSDHLKLRRPPFGTHSCAPTTIQGSTSTQSPSLGTATGMVEDVEAGSSGVRRPIASRRTVLPPSPRSSPLSITDQQGPEAGIAKNPGTMRIRIATTV
jgi:hypothetical protein